MGEIDNLINFLKKKGFRDTLQVLVQFEDYKTDMHNFYKELNKFSYYNSFNRVKYELLKKKLVSIERLKDKRNIALTKKGIDVYHKLIEINEIINQK